MEPVMLEKEVSCLLSNEVKKKKVNIMLTGDDYNDTD